MITRPCGAPARDPPPGPATRRVPETTARPSPMSETVRPRAPAGPGPPAGEGPRVRCRSFGGMDSGAVTDLRRGAAAEVLDRLAPADPTDASAADRVVRDGAALLVRRGSVLVRVRSVDHFGTAAREVEVAAELDGAGVPVTRLVAQAEQPWVLDGGVVTAWEWVDEAAPATPADLGTLARSLRLHTAALAGSLPAFDPVASVLGALEHLPADDPDAAFLRAEVERLADAWEDAARHDPLGHAVVHGDLHTGNVVHGPEGPLLTDLELTGSGPSSYDVAPTAVMVARYGADPKDLDDLVATLGADPRPWPGFATFVALYERWVAAWAVGVRHLDPAWDAEASRRIETLRDGADHTFLLH
jgi:aminoglycoside phosphotransferase (APT) family kinase protein